MEVIISDITATCSTKLLLLPSTAMKNEKEFMWRALKGYQSTRLYHRKQAQQKANLGLPNPH